METARYYLHDIWEELGDPRITHFPLMHGGPWKVMVIISLYLYFVKVLGPRYMKNRQPYDLRPLMIIYNSFLIGFNGVGFLLALWLTNWGVKSFSCGPLDPNTKDFKDTLLTYFGWLYFFSKFADWLDTIFFVLRKKYNQTTFLHVFHHGVMPLVAWFGMKFHPGGHSCFLPVCNVLVHSVMYSYYALAAAGPEMKKYLWWKKHITQLQMIQFTLTIIHSLHALVRFDCHWPKLLAFCELLHAALFFYMFYTFYKRVYCNNKITSDVNKETNGKIKEDKAIKQH